MIGRSSLTITSCFLVIVVATSVQIGLHAESPQDFRINESVRDEAVEDLDKPSEPSINHILPERFERPPKRPPGWVKPFVGTLMTASFDLVESIAQWTYQNRPWLPNQFVSFLTQTVPFAYFAGVMYYLARDDFRYFYQQVIRR